MVLGVMLLPSFLVGKGLVADLSSARDTLADSQAFLIPLHSDYLPRLGIRMLPNLEAIGMTGSKVSAFIAGVVLAAVCTNRHCKKKMKEL